MTRSIVGNYRTMKLNEVAAWSSDVMGILFKIANLCDQLHMYKASRLARQSIDRFKYRDDFKRQDGTFEASVRASAQMLNYALGQVEHLSRYDQDTEHSIINTINHAMDRLDRDSKSQPDSADMRVYSDQELYSMFKKGLSNYYSGFNPIGYTRKYLPSFNQSSFDGDTRDGLQHIFDEVEDALARGDKSPGLIYAVKQIAAGNYLATGYNFVTKKFEGEQFRESVNEGMASGIVATVTNAIIRGYIEQLGPMPEGVEQNLRQFLMGEVKNMTDKARQYVAQKKGMTEQVEQDKMTLSEGKSLMGKNLVNFLTIICMDSWYALQRKFSGNPDVFDVHQAESENPDFEVFKMTPGSDKRDAAYEYIMAAASQLTKALNSAFGKEVFEQRVSRTSGVLQVLVAFSAGKGGVFQCKAEMGEGNNTTIVLTMPNREELIRAFSAMTDTPHPKDEMLPADDFEAPDVAGRAVPKPAGADAALPGETGDLSADPGGPQLDPMGAPEEDPTRIPRMESTQTPLTFTVMFMDRTTRQNKTVQVSDPRAKDLNSAIALVRQMNPQGGNFRGVANGQVAAVQENADPMPDVDHDPVYNKINSNLGRVIYREIIENPDVTVGALRHALSPHFSASLIPAAVRDVARVVGVYSEMVGEDQLIQRIAHKLLGRNEQVQENALNAWRRAGWRLGASKTVKEEVAANSTGDAAENIGHQPTDGGTRKFMRRWKDAGKGFGWGNPFGDETGGNNDEYT